MRVSRWVRPCRATGQLRTLRVYSVPPGGATTGSPEACRTAHDTIGKSAKATRALGSHTWPGIALEHHTLAASVAREIGRCRRSSALALPPVLALTLARVLSRGGPL